MHLSKSSSKCLTLLYKSNRKLDVFTLFRRVNISFPEFSRCMTFLRENNYIEENDDQVKLTTKGVELISSRSSESFSKPWRSIPDEFLASHTSQLKMHVPSLRLLDKKAFPLAKSKVE